MMRTATVNEYIIWLKGYLAAGGEITHSYDTPMKNHGFVVATSHFTITPKFGARSRNIIVPRYVKWSGQVGHDNVYSLDGYSNVGSWIPTFSDAEFFNL